MLAEASVMRDVATAPPLDESVVLVGVSLDFGDQIIASNSWETDAVTTSSPSHDEEHVLEASNIRRLGAGGLGTRHLVGMEPYSVLEIFHEDMDGQVQANHIEIDTVYGRRSQPEKVCGRQLDWRRVNLGERTLKEKVVRWRSRTQRWGKIRKNESRRKPPKTKPSIADPRIDRR